MIYLLSPLKKEETISLPMIKFTLIQQALDLSKHNLLMFTSKQAVISANKLNENWKKIPCLAIGEATAKQIIVLGGKVILQPNNFYAKDLAIDIVNKFKRKKILYLRPKKVSFDSKFFLKKQGIHIDEKIIYETTCINYNGEDKPKKNAIIIFTSPSTIKCFFKIFEWESSYKAVVIGEATKVHLPDEVLDIFVAKKPLIEECIKLAKEL